MRAAHLRRWAAGCILPVLLLILWQAVAVAGLVSPAILPSPPLVFKTLAAMVHSGEMVQALGATASRMGFGFALGCVVGALVAFLADTLLAWHGLRKEGPLPHPKAG